MDERATALRSRRSLGRPVRQYVALCGLFVLAIGYQVLESRDIFHGLRQPGGSYDLPFAVDPLTARVTDPVSTEKWGIHRGDVLVAVDNVPYTGTHVLDDGLKRPHPNGTLALTTRTSNGGGLSATSKLQIPLLQPHAPTRPVVITMILLYVIMPFFCVILGFWVAMARPRDPLAWLLLVLLLGFTQLLGHSSGAWGPWIRDVARAYHLLGGNLWSLAMLLFGLYFPEPFPEQRWPVLQKLKWVLIIPLAGGAVIDAVIKTVAVERYGAVAWFAPYWAPCEKLLNILNFLAIGTFFMAIFAKGSMALSADAKRWLRLLYFGATIGLTPAFITVMAGLLRGRDVDEFLPEWLVFTVLLLMFLFPLTLAYSIVVQRAMDVRVVVRQGLQYALARGGISALRIALTAGAIAGAMYLLEQHSRVNSPLFYVIIVGTLLVGASMQRLGNRLSAWTDRRFFRDAYNAEVILSELSDKVRTIFETQPLLATVSHRIAESLHVPQVAVLIDGSGPYRPAYALGYSQPSQVVFPESAGTVQQLTETGEPTRVYSDDPDSWLYRRSDLPDEERRQLEQLGAELLLPLAAQNHLLGFISLGQKLSEEPYSGSDLRLLKSVAAQTGLALENSRLTATVAREVAQREKLNRELEIAREVQQRLFPQKLPAVHGLDYCGACRPALGVGGDYYDFLELPDGYFGIALGDVSGKGIAAALMMATLQASLRGEAMRGSSDLGQMISGVNRLVFEASTANRYATFFYAEYEPGGRTLTYVNAGHNPPMLFRRNTGGLQVLRLEVGGTVIGLLERFPFQQASIALELGDLLVLYTDGVSEAMNPQDEEWGESRMMEALGRCHGLSAQQTLEYTMAGADAFASAAPQHDDMTLVVLRVA